MCNDTAGATLRIRIPAVFGRGSINDRGGTLHLYDPRGCLPRMVAPYLTYSLPELQDGGTSIAFTPSAGQCVLFPGWLFHAVTTYRGQQPHISVAFNLHPIL